MQTLYVISTGGTIEKVYLEQTGSVANLETKIDRYLQMLRLPDLRIKTTNIMNKDSLEMTAKDRESVVQLVELKTEAPGPSGDYSRHRYPGENGSSARTASGLPEVSRHPHRRHDPAGIREERWVAESDGEPAGGALAASGGIPGHSQPGLSRLTASARIASVRDLSGQGSEPETDAENFGHSVTVTSIGAVSAKVPHVTLRVTLRMSSLG